MRFLLASIALATLAPTSLALAIEAFSLTTTSPTTTHVPELATAMTWGDTSHSTLTQAETEITSIVYSTTRIDLALPTPTPSEIASTVLSPRDAVDPDCPNGESVGDRSCSPKHTLDDSDCPGGNWYISEPHNGIVPPPVCLSSGARRGLAARDSGDLEDRERHSGPGVGKRMAEEGRDARLE